MACTIKLFTAIIVVIFYIATAIHFDPSPIFEGEARSLPLVWSPVSNICGRKAGAFRVEPPTGLHSNGRLLGLPQILD